MRRFAIAPAGTDVPGQNSGINSRGEMKLDISFKDGDPVIVDDRGQPMPCLRRVKVDYDFQEATEITIVIVVDDHNVTLGRSVDEPAGG